MEANPASEGGGDLYTASVTPLLTDFAELPGN